MNLMLRQLRALPVYEAVIVSLRDDAKTPGYAGFFRS